MTGIQYIMQKKQNNNRRNQTLGKKRNANVATARQARNLGPTQTLARNSRRIRHSELVQTISIANGTDTTVSVALNPGMTTSFPWLSTQADGWEQYRFHALSFEYVTRTATTTVGSVIMAVDYDAIDAPPADEEQITSYMGAVENAPWVDLKTDMDVKAMFPLGPRKYTRSSAVSGDLKTYDAGNLFVMSTGGAAAAAIGKLWVHYDVELFVPQTGSSGSPLAHQSTAFNLTAAILTSGLDTDVPIGYLWSNGLGAVLSASSFTLPRGAYNYVGNLCVSSSTSLSTAKFFIEKNGSVGAVNDAINDIPTSVNEKKTVSGSGFFTSDSTADVFTFVVNVAGIGTIDLRSNSSNFLLTVA